MKTALRFNAAELRQDGARLGIPQAKNRCAGVLEAALQGEDRAIEDGPLELIIGRAGDFAEGAQQRAGRCIPGADHAAAGDKLLPVARPGKAEGGAAVSADEAIASVGGNGPQADAAARVARGDAL